MMNKLQDNQISTDFEELSEEQQILQDAEQIIKQTQSEKKHTGKKVFLFVFLPLSILIIIALFFSTIFALLNINKDTIISGIYIQGISVSGLTKDEARAKVSEEIKSDITSKIETGLFDKEEKYITYKVHIIRDNETIDEITTKYNVSKEELEKYNDLNNIVLGTKIIIPISNEQ